MAQPEEITHVVGLLMDKYVDYIIGVNISSKGWLFILRDCFQSKKLINKWKIYIWLRYLH